MRPTNITEAVRLAVMAGHQTPAQVQRALATDPQYAAVSQSHVGTALRRLHLTGHVTRIGRGQYAPTSHEG